MAEKVYPDWVQKQKTTGTTVKKVGNNYYLYKHSSKRVPGKKNPVPADTYIGKITPDGIERSGSKKVDMDTPEVIVKEYGFSMAMESLCPAGWNPHIQLGAQKSSLLRRMRKGYGVEMRDIRPLMTIYIVRIAGRSILSVISDSQKEILEKLGLKLEVG